MKALDISRAIMLGTWTNDDLNAFIDAVKFNRASLGRSVKNTLRVGATVTWFSPKQGCNVQGEITKVAQKYATVCTSKGLWKVPMNMLTVVDKTLA